MPDSAIKAELFASVKKKTISSTAIPKPRTALLQEEENDVTVTDPTITTIIRDDLASAAHVDNGVPVMVSVTRDQYFASVKKKKEAENGMNIPASIYCVGNSETSINAQTKDTVTISSIDSDNICKDSKAVAGKLLKPSVIHFGSFADEEKEKDKKNIAAITSCNNRVRKVGQLMNDHAENMPKPRTALFQGREDDEPIDPQVWRFPF
ncbi:unnamed protein product [Urochloa humidicola]